MRKMSRILIFSVLFVFLASAAFAAFPERAVSVVCPWGAGGGTDRLTRFMAAQLEKELGKPFPVTNKTGGNGAVGHSAGAFSKPDGYTITMVTLELATMHWMGLTELTYADFDYVIQLNQDPAGVMVKADAPWKNLGELLEAVKADPEKFKFSGTAAGGVWDLARIGMLDKAGIPVNAVSWIPTTGAAPSIIELLGGHVEVITCSLPEAASQIAAGEIRPLAIMADSRDPAFPDVPTLKESGIDWSAGTWRGFAVPKGTPAEVIDVLYNAMKKITDSDEYKEFMGKNGFGVMIRGPKEFAEFVRRQDTDLKNVMELGGYLKK
ncbi:tripartite tricarboxylate transporter substrate binding protein [Aminivibrio sp.]|jgi:tripartite-type tricarboxylate transporter receptor subunit TctC|uniref:tripartite tricarboxylate transporter substrate binding protein n=1 Tax=Aminivibrio sp. TaxID=1872489 RepID=UPI001A37D3D4|nr:tripartite tricarboxylate transporter substrate binding protein [Aminivibrio sp.]MBL3538521.1 tripartite tricarboxylate transporter substrate binding protein [Aminivibrio sp.]MDK2958110.1 putative tricarboxylic transport rane protein [Synergistaceae bacterium]